MSSNIEIKRICQNCSREFIARTTVTKNCSSKCAKLAYKKKITDKNIEVSNNETATIKNKSIEDVKAKEFLSVKDVAQLIGCSVRTVYQNIENGKIKSTNISERLTRIKRTEIDKIFEQYTTPQTNDPDTEYHAKDYYRINEVRTKFNLTQKILDSTLKRNGISKIKQGKYVYVPKKLIDKLFKNK